MAMSWWTDLMQGIPVNAVLKERLALANPFHTSPSP
jgi:hypothetical protein